MQKRKKLVSVVMTVFNQEKYLAEAIESILGQTYTYFELVIIDDGSSDNTPGIISKYAEKDNRIKVLKRENKGRVYSLNQGISLSSGDYIAIMDSDDISHKERLEKQVAFLENNRNVFLVGSKIKLQFNGIDDDYTIKERNRVLKTSNSELDRNDIFSTLNDSFKILHPTWMFRKELYTYVGGYREHLCEDVDFIFRASSMGFIADRLDDVLLTYRVHGISRSDNKDNLKTDCLRFKTEYLLKEVEFPSAGFTYMIWGSDFSGRESHKYLEKILPASKLVAYIDSFKEGTEDGIPIIKPEKIKQQNPGYIFICTNGGGEYARKYLDNIGYRQMEDYFKII